MSLNRQRPRSRINTRANTLPSLTASNTTASFLPSIEESLEDWLTRSIPDTIPSSSESLDTCHCCKQPGCENLETVVSTIRKLESDARLAAEIGQSLLQKHEKYVLESNEIKVDFEEQLDQAKERIGELEQLLTESEAATQELQEKADKITREKQKIQKTLDQTAADFDLINQRCILLESELKSKSGEIDSLRVFKIMARQADIREDTLRLMLEDSKHELGVSRKKELSLEANFRKLKAKYETLRTSFERLKTSQHDTEELSYDSVNLAWLRESNERLRKDVLKLTSALLSPSNSIGISDQSQLVELIMELASANNKLKEDLLDCKDLLKESHNEINHLLSKLEDTEENKHMVLRRKSSQSLKSQQNGCGTELYKRGLSIRMHKNDGNNTSNFWLSSSAPEPNEESLSSRLRKMDAAKVDHLRRSESPPTNNDSNFITRDALLSTENVVPLPTSSTSMPTSNPTVVHHHYHYHMRKKAKIVEKIEDQQPQQNQQQQRKKKENENGKKKITINEPIIIPSSSKSTITIKSKEEEGEENHSPYRQLYIQVSSFHQRLKQSDTRAMNRKLRRAFDMPELSSMSNTIIENIIIDIDGMRAQYLWLEEKCSEGDVAILEFFPILGTFQDILKEIGSLRIAMNDLQVEYVKKIEERGNLLEKEVMKKYGDSSGGGSGNGCSSNSEKRNEHKITKAPPSPSSTSQGPFTWLTNVFQRSTSSSTKIPSQKQEQQEQQKTIYPSASQESLHRRYLFNSSDTNTIYSSSIHPLAIPQKSNEEDYFRRSSSSSRRKKSDFERYGPPSSFPERPSFSEKTRKLRQSSKVPMVRASQSAGTMRKSMQAPVLEYAVRKKRSTLGTLGSQTASPDLGGAFATSWLGNK